MHALVLTDRLRYEPSYPDPVAPPGEALVRVRLAGVCNTDLEEVRGYMAFRGVPGHEFVGEVLDASDPAWVGRRVVGDINAACHRCETCRAGRPTHCPARSTLGISQRDGAFAERLLLPEENLHAVPHGVTNEAAVFAEPLAAACEILEQARPRPSDRVAVVGDGKLGLLVAAVLRLTGAELMLVGRHDAKLRIAEDWGIATARDAAALKQGWFDAVVECSGSPEGLADARRLVRPRGMLVLKSTYHGDVTVNMSALVVDEISLIGSRCGPMEPALRLLESGLVDPRPLVSACYPLAEGEVAFARASAPGTLKVLIRP